jgi:hypothetical protein
MQTGSVMDPICPPQWNDKQPSLLISATLLVKRRFFGQCSLSAQYAWNERGFTSFPYNTSLVDEPSLPLHWINRLVQAKIT